MKRTHSGSGKSKRPWTTEKIHTAVRLTALEIRMLKSLVRHLRISQNATLALALRELHERELGREAA